jgi:transcriptional regulator with XRE-family HTH domain
MTIAEVGRRIGVGRSTAYKYETGAIAKIPDDKVEALAKLFGVSEPFLKGWSDKREVDPVETIGMPVPDGEKFIKLYCVMSYQDRVTLTEIYQRAYKKLEESESESNS